ncbi:MAG: diguanylate cyclase (GGDEF)-like protein [Alphaproteobacteria bacterium]|jgi:diguanylate cyclase (GGDEF)-like protein
MQLNVAQKTKLAIIDLTFAQTVSAAISHLFAIALIAFWFSHVAPLSELLVWVSAVVLITIVRISTFYAYKKYGNDQNANLWMHGWTSLFFILGIIYACGFIYFVPLDKTEYLVSIGMFVVALSAAAAIGNAANIYATLSFFMPVTIPSIVFLFLFGGTAGYVAGFTIVIYSVIALHLLRKSNKAYKKSIFLNFEHKQEIEKREQIEKQLHEISRKDSLTGLFNRRYFDEMLTIEIGRAKRNNLQLCLIIFDVDYFKEYNDKYGHVSGDNCLIQIAEIADSLVSRQGDIIARYGGEEFAIILPNIELEGAILLANALQELIQNENIVHADTKLATLKCVTISLGVTELILNKETGASELIENADIALYEAKRRGRNRVHADTKES